MNLGRRAGLVVVGIVALGLGVSSIGPVMTSLSTGSPGLLSGSGTSANPIALAVTTDGSITGTGSAGSAFSAQTAINVARTAAFAGFFGSGVDGSLNFDGSSTVLSLVPSSQTYKGTTRDTYTATRDIQATSVTVCASCDLRLNGFRLFVNGTLTNNGRISDDGHGQGNACARAAGFFPVPGQGANGTNAATNGGISDRTFSFVAANSTANGGASTCSGTTCANCRGNNATNGPSTFRGGGGGGGGNCNGCGVGGNGGNTTQRGTTSDGVEDFWAFVKWNAALGTAQATQFTSGSGGGGGIQIAPFTGGGGGCGGGVAWVAARSMVGGSFTAEGNVGGSSAGGWAGGGGGGGTVALFYATRTGGSTSVIGGNGGTGGCTIGAPGNGGVGASGLTFTFNLSGDGT